MNWRKIVWMFFWPLYRLFAELFFQFEIKGGENLKSLKKPFILAAITPVILMENLLWLLFPGIRNFFQSDIWPLNIIIKNYFWVLFYGSWGDFKWFRESGLTNRSPRQFLYY